MDTTVTKAVTRNINVTPYTSLGNLVLMLSAAGNTVEPGARAIIKHCDGSDTVVLQPYGSNMKLINSDKVEFFYEDRYDAEAVRAIREEHLRAYYASKYND